MRYVDFDPAKLTGEQKKWWDDWMKRADSATDAVIEAWERGETKLPFIGSLWGELKHWLLENVFHGKCAYCETRIIRFSGDAEHYRPKSEVKAKDPGTRKLGHVMTVDESGKQIVHPGYFWIAHHWKNILPSCEGCNRRFGKHTQFPLPEKACHVFRWKKGQPPLTWPMEAPRESLQCPGWLYLGPDDLDRIEKPLLLNPYKMDPRDYIRFGDCGIVTSIEGSPLGDASICVYDLKDEELRIARQEEQENASNSYLNAQIAVRGAHRSLAERKEAGMKVLEGYMSGKWPYSAAVLDYIALMR